MLKSILGTNCDVDRMVAWLRRGHVRVPLFFPKPCTIRWCTGQPSFCLPFGFYFSLGCFHCFFASLLFCFLDKAGVFVGSSIVVLPVFPFFLSVFTMSICFLFVFFLSLLLHLLRAHSCCTFASFVDFPVFSGGFLMIFFFFLFSFFPFLVLIFALGVKMYF